MPALTSEDDIGELTLSGGIPLSTIDRSPDMEADRLAKAAVSAVRVPMAVRGGLGGLYERARAVARWVGQVTAAVGCCEAQAGHVMRNSLPSACRHHAGKPARRLLPATFRCVELGAMGTGSVISVGPSHHLGVALR